MMKKWLLLPALLLLTVSAGAQDKSYEGINVMSYNIRSDYGLHKDGTNSWEFRWKASVDVINDIKPDVMLIEPTGLALPSKIKETLNDSGELFEDMPRFDEPEIIGVVDAVRFPVFAAKKETFVRQQLEGSKAVLINKIDVASAKSLADTEMWLALNVGKVPMYKMSAITGEGVKEALEAVTHE